MFSIQHNFTITKRHKTNYLIFVLFISIFFCFNLRFHFRLPPHIIIYNLCFISFRFFFLYVNINKYGLHHKTIVNSHFTFDCEQEDRENPFRSNKTKEKREKKHTNSRAP